jgi:hypothetical protein
MLFKKGDDGIPFCYELSGGIRAIDLPGLTLDVFGCGSVTRERLIAYARAQASGQGIIVVDYCAAIGWSKQSLYAAAGRVASHLNARHRENRRTSAADPRPRTDAVLHPSRDRPP